MVEPPYVALYRSGELERRAARALELLGEPCRVCPRLCSVDRLADERGLCRIGRRAMVASHFPHFGEENCLRGTKGSGTVFFSGCNLRCVFCLPPGSLVATERGPVRIEELFENSSNEVRAGDGLARRPANVRVATVTGELAAVSKTFRHPFRGELVKVKPLSAPELRLTPNHRVFAARRSDPDRLEQVPAGDLTSEHYLVVPKRQLVASGTSLDVAEVLGDHVSGEVHVRGRRVGEEVLVPALTAGRSSADVGRELGYHPAYVRQLRGKLARGVLRVEPSRPRAVHVEGERVRFGGEHRPGIPRVVPLDRGVAWLLGLYCAEGHVTSNPSRPNSHRLVLSFGHHERDAARWASASINRVFRVVPTTVERRTTVTVESGKSSLALFFRNLCGSGAGSKRVPPQIFEASEDVVRSFLEGYLAGDGTLTATHLVANTVSAELAHGLYELGLRLNVLPSIHRWVPPRRTVIEGRSVRQSPLWYVKFKRDRLNGSPSQRGRAKWRDMGAHFLVPIHRIERERYEGHVYNLEVDHPTHSYVAPAVAVANCQNFDVSWQVHGEEVSARRLAAMMLELQSIGCHNINWVTPEHVVPQILEALPIAVEGGLRLPIVYNTSAYDSADSLELMDRVVDVYMPDLKLASPEATRRYLGKREYAEVAMRNVREMHRQVGDLVLDEHGMARRGLIVRHLVMPGLLDETEEVLRFVAEELGPGTYVNLMGQYYPAGKVERYEEINRRPEREELERAFEIADGLGLRRLDARRRRQSVGVG